MDLDRIDIKLYVDDAANVHWPDFTEIFTRWRDEDPDEWLDIADYLHVPSGPGLLLIGTHAHVGMDNRYNRPGLLYSRREPFEGDTSSRIAQAFRAALEFADRLEKEDAIAFRFRTDAFDFIVNDRVAFPNDEETFQALRDDVRAAVEATFGESSPTLSRETDPKERLTFHVRLSENRTVGQVLEDLAVHV